MPSRPWCRLLKMVISISAGYDLEMAIRIFGGYGCILPEVTPILSFAMVPTFSMKFACPTWCRTTPTPIAAATKVSQPRGDPVSDEPQVGGGVVRAARPLRLPSERRLRIA